jgi:thiamine kinase-like enzyme
LRPSSIWRRQNVRVEEHPLGGNLSDAIKVGDTVRRRAGPWTAAVHALLNHLHRVGFDAAPEPLGTDPQGRAVLKFIPGEVHQGWPDPMPSWVYEDDVTLVEAARLLRRYHDLLASFNPPPDARWRIVAPGAREVICHNDWAPYNALFEGHRPIAMLDWDSAGPGSRVWDVAWSAYTWVPLYPKPADNNDPVLPLPGRASRLARFCAAYGGVEPSDVLETLVEQLRFLADFVQAEADAGDPGFVKLAAWNVPARTREHAAVIREQTHLLLRRV